MTLAQTVASQAIVVLDERVVIFTAPADWSQSALAELTSMLRAACPEYKWIVLPGPAVAYDFRGDEELKALAQRVHERVSGSPKP